MQVEGFITGWQEDAQVADGSGYIHDVKRTVTFHFSCDNLVRKSGILGV